MQLKRWFTEVGFKPKMLESEFIQCPICEAPLLFESTPLISLWTCSKCGSVFTAHELAEEWEPAPENPKENPNSI
jgi:rubredoxin